MAGYGLDKYAAAYGGLQRLRLPTAVSSCESGLLNV